ncbi:hypothetical protein OA860_00425, partial [Prochlorococcus sp. AH-716-E13]|nr:hypothetical protein [Prochlorococcus sp. AH-716-E13]
SNLAKIYKRGTFKVTRTKDNGELHPWSTWPSLHRGVPNYEHNIRFINQDLDVANKNFPPFWVDLASSGIDVGIFGSLQSFPPIYGDNYKFYLPDTFSPNEESFPNEIKKFQKFNLKLAGKNKAISGSFDFESMVLFSKLIFFKIIGINSILTAFIHLFKELVNSKYKKRRSLIQPILSFDVFWKHYKKYRPKFSTFFTNHVAGMMHRYWQETFPEDFDLKKDEIDIFNSKSIFKAMDIADEQIGAIIDFCDKNATDLLVLSGMGQESINWGEYQPEIYLADSSIFLKNLKLTPTEYSLLPSMHPDLVFDCISEKALNRLIESATALTDYDGNKLITLKYAPVGLRVNFSLGTETKALRKDQKVFNTKNKLEDKIQYYGLKLITRDQGTAYHCPEGILLAYGRNSEHFNFKESKIVDICKIKPKILSFFGVF